MLVPGIRLVDAPVLGSVAAAASGQLAVLAGGAVERVRPVLLESLGAVWHCGDLGSGAALKLVANTALVSAQTAAADARAVAARTTSTAEACARCRRPLADAVARAIATSAFPVALAAKTRSISRARRLATGGAASRRHRAAPGTGSARRPRHDRREGAP